MKNMYVTAFTDLILDGKTVEEALSRISAYMKDRGHLKLLPTVLTGARRVLTVKLRHQQPQVTVAKSADATLAEVTAALAELGAADVPRVVVDDNLIGGYIVEYRHRRKNASYKHQLVDLYREIVKA